MPKAQNSPYRSVRDDASASNNFTVAREKIRAGQVREALPLLESYIQQNPNGEFVDESLFFLGRNALSANDLEGASRQLNRLALLSPPSRLRGQALFYKAMAESRKGDRREALDTLSHVDVQEIPSNQRAAFFELWGSAALQEGRGLESTLAYVKTWKYTDEPTKKRALETVITEQISSRLNESDLSFLLKEYPSDYPASEIQLRLALLKLASGERPEAQQLLSQVMGREVPGSPLHQRASELWSRLSSLGNVSSGKIGLLLPLSGEQESLGRAVVDGFREAFSGKEAVPGVEIVLADVGPTVESAKTALERLVFEDKVMTVVGPLAGSQAQVVAQKANEWGVPNISLSARADLLEMGPNVFRVALTPAKQVQALVGYASEKVKARNFAVIFPRDGFGREFAQEYFKAVEIWGGRVTAAESYEPDQSDFRLGIENMVGTAFPDFRKAEYEEKLKLAEEKVGRKLSRKEIGANSLPPIVDFDVVLIPDTFRAVGQIVPALLYADVTTVKIMGPSTWHNSRLLQRAGQYMEGGILVDVFAPERVNSVTREFVDKFQVAKGTLPTSLSATGYDIALALKEAYGSRGPESRDSLRSRLQSLGKIEGACGVYKWDSRREPLAEVQLFLVKRGAFSHQGGIVIRTSGD